MPTLHRWNSIPCRPMPRPLKMLITKNWAKAYWVKRCIWSPNALTLIHEDKPKTRIEVWVKEGFAVAEVKLQHCKEDTENEDWEEKLDPAKAYT